MKVLVIPDIHLKPWMFARASELMKSENADSAVCLMDIPDDFNQEYNLDLYKQTFDAAIDFHKDYKDTLWCWGNHDLSYVWRQPESGFSTSALMLCRKKIEELKDAISDHSQLAYIHRIDNVLFMHGGLTKPFAKYYAPLDYDSVDDVVDIINEMSFYELWDDASPIWCRPYFEYREEMYMEEEYLQVVGHTPVKQLYRDKNVLFCDVFSTYYTGEPIGAQDFLLIDTKTWEFEGVK